MIVLYQYAPAYSLPNASPFCMKVENYLRMTGLDYRSEYGLDLPGSPKGKLPYIRDGGVVMGDSGLIIDYLKATYGDPLDGRLSATERAVTLAFIRLMDEHLYWAGGIQPRWVEDAGWRVTRTALFRRHDRAAPPYRPAGRAVQSPPADVGPRDGALHARGNLRDGLRRYHRLGGLSRRQALFPRRAPDFAGRRRLCQHRQYRRAADRLPGQTACADLPESRGVLPKDAAGVLWR